MELQHHGLFMRYQLRIWLLISPQAHRNAATAALSIRVSSSDLLDLNLSQSFVELAIATSKQWSKEGDRVLQKARGSYAPYKIVNRSGGPIYVWSDSNGSDDSKSAQSVKIDNGSTVDWRFDDWRKMREVLLRSYSIQICETLMKC